MQNVKLNDMPILVVTVYAVATFTDHTKSAIRCTYNVNMNSDMSLLKPILLNITEQKFPHAAFIDFVDEKTFETLCGETNITIEQPIYGRNTVLLNN